MAFLEIGKGYNGIELFSMIMNVHPFSKSTFFTYTQSINESANKKIEEILDKARTIVKNSHLAQRTETPRAEEITDIVVSYDGSWFARGHNSLLGVGCVIDVDTGYVIDFEIMSKYCHECVISKIDLGEDSPEFEIWMEGHKSNCQKNHSGSSGAMEMAAAEVLWRRSQNFSLRYSTMLSDGDAKTLHHLSEIHVYGENFVISKEECINHVKKRLGTALREVIKVSRNRGITLGERTYGSLKGTTIDTFCKYYQAAIYRNKGDVTAMKNAIMAIIYHCVSTDENPQHQFCPNGEDSWCFYQSASSRGDEIGCHKTNMRTPINQKVFDHILPIFERLLDETLLDRCKHCRTQNANESLHSLIWNKCPKETFVSRKRLQIAVAEAVAEYNNGFRKTAHEMPKYVLSTIKKKIVNPNPHIALFGLLVLESCVKNCGSLIHDEIGTKQYMEQLWEVVKNTQHEEVKIKILELIQAWAYAFRKSPKYRAVQDIVNIMRAEGHKFPSLKESDAMFSADTAPEWADGTMCHRCRVPFGIVQRKHHCRACGQVFCQQCSSKNSTLPKFGFEKEVRVCESCYEQFHKPPTSSTKETELPAEYLSSSLAQQQQVPPRKTEDELREEEELQLALALSQSEAEQKEKDKKKSTAVSRANSVTVTKVTYSPSPAPSSTGVAEEEELDPELAKYLNRQYWEQRQQSTEEHSSNLNITSPSAPNIGSHISQKVISLKQQNGEVDTEMEMFVNALQSQVEIFVNRMKSNSSRGRSIANDSSVQTWFMNITAMHSRLLRYIQQQDDKRVYYEGLQDKVAQIKESRAALDALREEHREKLRRQAEEAERQRQLQMAHKLEIMRKKKQEYLQYQRQLALQRIQEQEREMQMRQEQQKQQYIMGVYQPVSSFIGPSSQNSPVHHVQYQNPECNYNPISPTGQSVYSFGQPPTGVYPMQNYGLPVIGSVSSHIMNSIVNQEQQQLQTDLSVQSRENHSHVTISGPTMISQIGGPLQSQNTSSIVLSNQQNDLSHVRPPPPPPTQGIPTHALLSQRLPSNVIHSNRLQPAQAQGSKIRLPSCPTGAQTNCPTGQNVTSVHDSSGQAGHLLSLQQQGPSLSHENTMQQQSLNINFSARNSGHIQVPEQGLSSGSTQLSQQSTMKGSNNSELSETLPRMATNLPVNFETSAKSQSTENIQQNEGRKLDIAELISFD